MSGFYAWIDKYRVGICIVLCVLALVFIMFGHIYREQIQLILKNEFCKFPECSIDYWSLSHFILFGVFGFLIPDKPLTFFTLGVGFELVEDFLSSDKSTQLADCSDPFVAGSCNNGGCKRRTWCNGIQDDYWYCNLTDPWVNLTGYIVGSAIRTTFT